MANKYLFYISQNYSFEILRPLQQEIRDRGDHCAWFVEGNDVNKGNFQDDEILLADINKAVVFQPDAVFVPGNTVPNFISGLKIQVFHGLEWKKKGHFGIRGCFDLYCTHGQHTTEPFNRLADQYGYFQIVETGWPKLDPLFQSSAFKVDTKLPVVLFAPTFSPKLTCALDCLDEIKRLVKKRDFYWLVKFHPKMNKDWVNLYQQIDEPNFQIVNIDSCLPLLQRADIMLSDTSSIIGEFLLLDKPAVTYKNSVPGPYLINIESPSELESALQTAAESSQDFISAIIEENQKLHPYKDGQSSSRILDAVEKLLVTPTKPKKNRPLSLFRNLKIRKKLNYWKF